MPQFHLILTSVETSIAMKLPLIILAALIALAAGKPIEECEQWCKKDSTEMSQYCVQESQCYIMIPQCMVDQIKCIVKHGGQDPAEVLSTFEDNCKDKKPKCDNIVSHF
ncbi:uncharacterized protein [Drosophila pseudoobscura]|uniref:Uncharacterized protein n=1 Tax=Drosophila pseudoobscura pseudoobscura TaxID=46245 RepID=A0A6I8UX13_DROPS|nr:uncharacterized protein LOC6903454 [Drosophila pseudoobscura]